MVNFFVFVFSYEGVPIKQVHFNLYKFLVPTSLAEALCIIPVKHLKEYCQYYIHDFIRTIHHVSHSQSELELQVKQSIFITILA